MYRFSQHYEVAAVIYCSSFWINSPAIAADVKVLIAPVSMALTATRETSPPRLGAS